MTKIRPVVFFEIRGRDAKRLREFYAALFDWQIDTSNPAYAFVGPGEGGPELGVSGGIAQAGEPGVSIYVQVADLTESLAQGEALGGKALLPPTDVPGGPTIARLQDPEGNVIGLVQQ